MQLSVFSDQLIFGLHKNLFCVTYGSTGYPPSPCTLMYAAIIPPPPLLCVCTKWMAPSVALVCNLGILMWLVRWQKLKKTNQEKYVPCSSGKGKKNILTKIPFHGDQLFEERARNIQMTFQDGITCYECLEGLSPEAADWHAKVNLYSVSGKITGSMITYPTMMPKRLDCMESCDFEPNWYHAIM